MHPSALLTALTIGLYSLSLVQGSGGSKNIRRVNRLRSVLPEERQETVIQSTELEPVVIAANEPQTVQEITGFDALVNAASSATRIETEVEEEKKDEESVQIISETVPVVSLEDRRVALFESLYIAYENAVGRYCRPGMIEWSRANVFNWPEYIDKSDMSNWTEEHVELLSFLVDSGSIGFKPVSRGKKNPPKPLVSKRRVFIMPIMPVTEQEAKVAEEKAQVDSSSDSDLVSLSDNEIKNKPAAPVEKASTLLKSKSKKRIVGKMNNFKSIKVDSHLPANPERKAAVLAEVMIIYRRDSGHPAAEEIDWSSFKVFYLQNHTIPFSTGFETEGDVRTLEALMKNKYFGFHNPQVISSRRFAIYERLYKLYAKVPGLVEIDPFLVKWNQINVIGWPKDVSRSYNLWKLQEVTKMECLLDAGEIRFTLNNGKKPKKMIKRTRIESSSDEESEYMSESSSSESSIKELVESSDESVDSSTSSSSSSGDDENAAVVLAVARNKRKRETTKLVETATNENQISIGAVENINKMPRMTVEVNETTKQIENIKTEIVAVIENLTKAKEETFAQNDRHKRIVSHLIKCFSLLQKHANNEVLEMPANEVLDFIEIFHKALAAIRVDGEMSQAALKNFVIGGIKLRARLAGIGYTQERGRRVFKIPVDRIKDTESFGVLTKAESLWTNELDLLEFALDAEEPYIFS